MATLCAVCWSSLVKQRKIGEPRYCNKNVATPRATSFTYQPKVRTNLEVTLLYAQVKVKVLPIVNVHLEKRPQGFLAKLL